MKRYNAKPVLVGSNLTSIIIGGRRNSDQIRVTFHCARKPGTIQFHWAEFRRCLHQHQYGLCFYSGFIIVNLVSFDAVRPKFLGGNTVITENKLGADYRIRRDGRLNLRNVPRHFNERMKEEVYSYPQRYNTGFLQIVRLGHYCRFSEVRCQGGHARSH